MKANEMPERVYLFDYNDAMVTPLEGDTVYVMEDAFIEKACEYLQINLWRVVNEEPDFRQRFVTDFRNYMKRE